MSKFKTFPSLWRWLEERGPKAPISAVDIALRRIEEYKDLNAFIDVWAEEARQLAEQLASEKKKKPLHGLIVGVKDNIAVAGKPLTAASKILQGYKSPFSATVVERIKKAGAILIGRNNCDEFAMGSGNEYSYYGPSRNPYNPALVPGGSSGGSAVAVATGQVMVALGSDTGGSVRQPAAYCGVIGYKPTYGLLSRYGLIAFASSLDQIGIIANNVEDIAAVMSVAAGKDPMDATSVPFKIPNFVEEIIDARQQKFKIGVIKETVEHKDLHPDVAAAMEKWISILSKKGHTLEYVSLPLLDYVVPMYQIIATAEASANLARYDGVRYGYRAEADSLEEMYIKTRTEGFGMEVKRRIMMGTFVLSSGFYDAYYMRALRARRLLVNYLNDLFKQYELLMLPTTPAPAFPIGSFTQRPVEMYLVDVFTVIANLAGIPAISLPLAWSKDGLPLGIQFMSKAFDDSKLLSFSASLFN